MMGCHGLSPLARGTREFQDFSSLFPRFIPAGAGNTHSSGNTDNVGTVYPRWRGEHMRGWMHGSVRCGLSPLARGTHMREPQHMSRIRFIPAGAGNTAPVFRDTHLNAGLSPLARGTRNGDGVSDFDNRFIPAGAGNTRAPGKRRPRHAVYPRWRGEHPFFFTSPMSLFGLSPLARGTRPRG